MSSTRNIKTHFTVMTVFVGFVILFPALFVSSLPIYVFRFIASLARKAFRPDLDRMITTRSAVIAIDDPSDNPNWNLCVWLTLEGNLDFEQFKVNFLNDIVLKKNSDGEFVNPEFQQFYQKWLGFLFWKWEECFDINEHMKHFFPIQKNQCLKVTTEEELKEVIKTLTTQSFEVEKSPWEFFFIPNYLENGESISNKSILFFRVHHGFCDGYSILRLLLKEVNKVSMDKIAKPIQVKRNILSKVVNFCFFWIRAPYEFIEMMITSKDENEWHLPIEKLEKPFNTSFTQRIPLDYIKNIKNSHNVAFTSIIMASLTGGLRNMMLEVGVKVPKYITTAIAVPMPGHPSKLRNHFIFALMKLPVGIADSRKRLATVERNFQDMKRSPVTLFSFAMIPIIGGLFTWMINLISKNEFTTALTSNFPGPSESIHFIGGGGSNRVTDMNFSGGMGVGNVGIGFCMMSYDQGMRIVTSVDKCILSTDEAVDVLNRKILEEFEHLKMLNCP